MPSRHILLLLAVSAVSITGLWLAGPIPQDPAYHNFADQRTIFSIPNFWNVASNLPMLVIGIYAMWHTLRHWRQRPNYTARLITLALSFGIFTACFGSMYYHWSPDNLSLVWDRLPMTLMFMPLLALIIYDCLGERAGSAAFYLLFPLGIFSVFYWRYTESIGQGDLRFYAFVQFFPMVIAPFLIWLFSEKLPYVRYALLVLGWYVVVKIAEYYDAGIYEMTGFWSGHTVKHLLGAVPLVYVVKIMQGWRCVQR